MPRDFKEINGSPERIYESERVRDQEHGWSREKKEEVGGGAERFRGTA